LLAAIGGCAMGGLVWGGCAVGGVAIGGMAVGVYAFGGGGVGMHMLSSTVQDPEAKRFFEPWAYEWTRWMTWLSIALPVSWVGLFLWIRWMLRPAAPRRSEPIDDGARLSRKAVWGAAWAPLGFGAFSLTAATNTVVVKVGEGREMPPGIELSPWAQALAVAVSIVVLAAPFCTTILGLVAISEIRRSKGKLYGLPLAVADALLFPLLVFDGLIFTAVYFAVPQVSGTPLLAGRLAIPALLAILAADVLIARAAWRAAASEPFSARPDR